jgi:hypothetical protein
MRSSSVVVAVLAGASRRRARGPARAGTVPLALAVVVAQAALAPASARAQEASRSVGLLVSHSLASATSAQGSECFCGGRDVLAPVSISSIELELSLPIRAESTWGVDVPLRAIPIVVARNNPSSAAYQDTQGVWAMSLDTPRSSTRGFGIKPLGLRAWAGRSKVRLFADASAGVVHFGTPLLASNATRFNFVYDLGLGVQVDVPGAGRLALGFRRHHLSNAGLGEVNPGLDSDVAYLGFWLY